jgi:polyhydroxyalkanoate synthesis regulator phasin
VVARARPAAAAPDEARAAREAAQATAASRAGARGDGKQNGDTLGQIVNVLREQLAKGVFEPLNLVMLASERIQEALDEAVERGRLTRGDANELVTELLRRGRQQTDDVLGDLPTLLSKGIDQLDALSRRVEGRGVSKARQADSVDRLMRSADRARRAVGVGPSFPILGYDELAVVRVTARIADLTPRELRKVRDYERANQNRAAIIRALDKALA